MEISEQICPKCGFNFNSPANIKPICPYCEKKLHLNDFNITVLDKKGCERPRGFKGEFSLKLKIF